MLLVASGPEGSGDTGSSVEHSPGSIVEVDLSSGQLVTHTLQRFVSAGGAVDISPTGNFVAVDSDGGVDIYERRPGGWHPIVSEVRFGASIWTNGEDRLLLKPYRYADGLKVWTQNSGSVQIPGTSGRAICSANWGRDTNSVLVTTCSKDSTQLSEIDATNGATRWVLRKSIHIPGHQLQVVSVSPKAKWAVLKLQTDVESGPDLPLTKRYGVVEIGSETFRWLPFMAHFGNPTLVAWIDDSKILIVAPNSDLYSISPTQFIVFDAVNNVTQLLATDDASTVYDAIVFPIVSSSQAVLSYRRFDGDRIATHGWIMLDTRTGVTSTLDPPPPYVTWTLPRQ